jgi:hypothetical protein
MAENLESYERAFRRAGLPLLIEDYSPAEDIFNRAVPLLGLVFFAEILSVLNRDWPPLANVVAMIGGLALLLGTIALSNRARGRPLRSLPERVGRAELAGFVLVPALLPGLISGHWGIACLVALGNLALLVMILAVVGFGVVSIFSWSLRRLASELSSSLALMVKAVPLLMIFSLILFFTPELWQVFARLDDVRLALLICLFLLLGGGFLIARLPNEVEQLERETGGETPPLNRLQELNIGLVLFIAQSVQILLVCLGVALFFCLLGFLTLDAEILHHWLGTTSETVLTIELGDAQIFLSVELLRVSCALAAFTGLYFTISMLTDSLYRAEFMERITDEMRQVFRLRRDYLAARAAGEEAAD